MVKSVFLSFLVGGTCFATGPIQRANSDPVAAAVLDVALNLLPPETRAKALSLLRDHPDIKDVQRNDRAELLAFVTEQPNRQSRPRWHFMEIACIELGGIEGPKDRPGQGAGSNLETRELDLLQATDMCLRLLRDTRTSDVDRVQSLYWVINLTAGCHRPTHAGSLYSPAFPKGDDWGNKVLVSHYTNLNRFWRDCYVDAIPNDPSSPALLRELNHFVSGHQWHSKANLGYDRPSYWLRESIDNSRRFVYSPEIRRQLDSNDTKDGANVLVLSQEYQEAARSAARERFYLASYRLSLILAEAVESGTGSTRVADRISRLRRSSDR